MFSKIFALLALVAMAFAAPNPKPEPKPAPQYLTYSSGLDYVYPQAAAAVVPQVAAPYAAYGAPLAYSAYPAGAVYYR